LLIGCVVLVGCSTGSNSSGSTAGGVAVERLPANGIAPAPDKPATGGAPSGTGAGKSSGGAGQAAAPVNPLPATGRQVIRSASIALTTPDVTRTAAGVRQITDSAGGYVGTENTQAGQADFSLQVPEPVLDNVLDRIAALGHVTDRSGQSQDVTDQLVDVRSRVASQQASVNRVRALLDKATSIGDVVTIEGELATRESDLESLEQRQAELSAQVAMSTVTVHIGRDTTVPPPVRKASAGGFGGGLAAGWHSFVGVLGGVLTFVGVLLPFLVGLGVPAALIWWFVRRRRGGKLAAPMIDPDAG